MMQAESTKPLEPWCTANASVHLQLTHNRREISAVNPSIELPHASTDAVHDSADTPPWPGIPGIGDMIGQNNLACAKPIDFDLLLDVVRRYCA